MRFRRIGFVLLVCAGVATFFFRTTEAQTRVQHNARARTINGASAQVHGNLVQVMRGVLFPNSNVIFFAQDKNPADVMPDANPFLSTDPLTGSFGGWDAVENSAPGLWPSP